MLMVNFSLIGSAFAGSITSPGGAPAATSYTLSDIFTRLTANIAATLSNHSLSPTTTPQASFHSLTDIYNAIPTIYAGDFLASSTYLGVTGSVAVKTGDTSVASSSAQGTSLVFTIPAGYYDGSAFVTVSTTSSAFIASNIKLNTYLFGITGTYSADGSPSIGSENPLKTGQTVCYDAGGLVVACAGTNQDADLLRGTARSYTDNADDTISDNATGLMWEKCTQGLSGSDCTTGTATTMTRDTALTTCESATTGSHSDWRLPNVNELGTLLDYAATPMINATYFPAVQTGTAYYSSTNVMLSRPNSWIIWFDNGDVTDALPSSSRYVRCVRTEASPASSAAAQPLQTGQTTCYNASGVEISCAGTGQDGEYQAGAARSYTNNGDDTITDNATGLMWQRCHLGYQNTYCDNLSGSAIALNWVNAIAACEATTTASYTDWHLPNINEIKSIIDYSRGNGDSRRVTIDPAYFPSANVDVYKTGTTNPSVLTRNMYAEFWQGEITGNAKTTTDTVRCVRNAI